MLQGKHIIAVLFSLIFCLKSVSIGKCSINYFDIWPHDLFFDYDSNIAWIYSEPCQTSMIYFSAKIVNS